MVTDVEGVLVGHWTRAEARTGCTVVLLPPGTTASGEIRGGAPATREFGLLEPWRMVPSIDAVALSGGSAFGLATGDGVMRWLEEQGRGFETAAGRVPIVVGMSLFDLGVGDAAVRPGADEGWAAAAAATSGPVATGVVGAGTGATVGKWGGPDEVRPGGIVTATVRSGEVVVSVILAVNAYGWVDDGTSAHDPGPPVRPPRPDQAGPDQAGPDQAGPNRQDDAATGAATNTTIGVVVTNATVDKVGCHLMAQAAHDGLARSLFPAHTSADGDAIVAAATGRVETPDPVHLRLLAQLAVTRAVRSLLAATPPTT